MTLIHSLASIGLPGMFRTEIGPSVEYWRVIRFAMVAASCYIAWLRVFEHWLEPTVRRVAGRLLGRAIVWVPALGPFRSWGLRDCEGSAVDAAVGVSGYVAVIISAVVPAALLHVATLRRPDEWSLPASSYLASILMSALFVVRLLLGQSEAD
jgi:hypothetical protein